MGMIGNSLAQGLISGANIQDGTVDVADLKDGSVTDAKINDVAATKLTGSVATSQIADDAVTSAKLDTNISVDGSLTVDTDTLVVDAANNRVGVGTSAPDRPLSITDGTNDGTGGVKIASYLPVLEMDDISGGGTSFKIEHDQTSTSFKHDSTVRATLADNGAATFTGASGTSEGNLRSTSSSGHSYIGVNRDTAGQGELGYSWNTGGATKWWNYLSANSDEMKWYSNGANRLTLTQSGHLTADGGITSSGALNQTGETQSNISSVFLGTQKLGNNKTLYTYDHYDISWNTSTETKNIFEVSHDTANWGTKYIMIEVFQTMYGGGGYARYYLNHQYGSNTLNQIEKNGSNSNVTAQMTGLTTVTGNVKKSTFQLVLGYYQEAYVRVTSTMSASTSITAANQLRFL